MYNHAPVKDSPKVYVLFIPYGPASVASEAAAEWILVIHAEQAWRGP
jgi:hypothetical protein